MTYLNVVDAVTKLDGTTRQFSNPSSEASDRVVVIIVVLGEVFTAQSRLLQERGVLKKVDLSLKTCCNKPVTHAFTSLHCIFNDLTLVEDN